MVRGGFDVDDAVLFEFRLEPAGAVPVGVLPAIVGEHLFGRIILRFGLPEDFDEVVGRLAAEKVHAHYVAGKIVDEADEVGVVAAQAKGEDVRLPELVGCAALEEARAGGIMGPLSGGRIVETLFGESPPDGLRAGRKKEQPPQGLRDAPDPRGRFRLLQVYDFVFDCGRKNRSAARTRRKV